MSGFLGRLRSAVAKDPDAALVLLGNFEVEDRWAIGERGLPRMSLGQSRAVVNRMDEFALLLAGEADHVVLKAAPDAGYLTYLEGLGVGLPTVLLTGGQDPELSVSQEALAAPHLLAELGRLASDGALLVPHGVSDLEEALAAAGGIELAAPPASVCKEVNSKVYSRRLAGRLGLRQPAGRACGSVEELDEAVEWAASVLAAGRTVAVKDAFGVSGKGIVVVAPGDGADRLRRLRRLRRMVTRATDQNLALVVEEWVAKDADLNYQFTLGRDGGCHFDFVKEALTEGGVHKGHRIPARLSDRQLGELRDTAAALGRSLAADGYFGVVGVDAMTDPDGGLYPVVEINARNNMSTYQVSLQERFMCAGQSALARQYPLRLTEPLPFAALRRRLGGLLFDPAAGTGLLVNNFATVNAGAAADRAFDGRLYGLLIADSAEQLTAMDGDLATRLTAE